MALRSLGGGRHSGESPVSAVKKVLAGWIETCALIYLCVCVWVCGCVRVSNNRLRGLSVGPLSLFSAPPHGRCRPPPGQAALPLGTPAGVGSVFGTMRTLWFFDFVLFCFIFHFHFCFFFMEGWGRAEILSTED